MTIMTLVEKTTMAFITEYIFSPATEHEALTTNLV